MSGTRKATGLYLADCRVRPIGSQTLLALRSRKIVFKNTVPVERPPTRMTPPLGSSTSPPAYTTVPRGGPYLQTCSQFTDILQAAFLPILFRQKNPNLNSTVYR